MKPRVLVLDGDHKNALAIVRHLGRAGRYAVEVAARGRASIARFSKYAARTITLPDPKRDPEAYANALLATLETRPYAALVPVSYISFQVCAGRADEIRALTRLAIAGEEAITLASDKMATYRFAASLGVPVPKTVEVRDEREVGEIEMTFPCVIKAPFEMGKNVVEYARDREELARKFARLCREYPFGERLPVVQQHVSGDGFGFFAYYEGGACRARFMHRRLREYPVTGGASTAAESCRDEELAELGTRLLDALHWEGVAMVEFKQDAATGVYYLMEINAKFWGSLDLALVAGVDFPGMMVAGAPAGEGGFADARFQWLLNGELFHALERPRDALAVARDLFRSRNDVWLRDPLPNLFQLLYIPVHYYKKLSR
jgi:predicted ATP-grasp superfamily ATP-dependent carboligase